MSKEKMEKWAGLFSCVAADDCTDLTGFYRFESKHGIDGLARVENETLQLLVVFAAQPGRGQFRAFMKQAKETFSRIEVWEVWSKLLAQILPRYGFRPHQVTASTDEVIEAWLWEQEP